MRPDVRNELSKLLAYCFSTAVETDATCTRCYWANYFLHAYLSRLLLLAGQLVDGVAQQSLFQDEVAIPGYGPSRHVVDPHISEL